MFLSIGIPRCRTIKILERMEPDIFQLVTGDQIGLLRRKTRLGVISNVSHASGGLFENR